MPLQQVKDRSGNPQTCPACSVRRVPLFGHSESPLREGATSGFPRCARSPPAPVGGASHQRMAKRPSIVASLDARALCRRKPLRGQALGRLNGGRLRRRIDRQTGAPESTTAKSAGKGGAPPLSACRRDGADGIGQLR